MMINPNILDEGNQMLILDISEFKKTGDELDLIVRCNNCGQPTKYGKTRMSSGLVGCDNKIVIDGKEIECFYDDLRPRVVAAAGHRRNAKLYRWRDGADGGINNE